MNPTIYSCMEFYLTMPSGQCPMILLTILPLCWWWPIWPIQNDAKKMKKWLKPWHMGSESHLRLLSESYVMNTNMLSCRWFSKIFASLCFGWKYSSSIGRDSITIENKLEIIWKRHCWLVSYQDFPSRFSENWYHQNNLKNMMLNIFYMF